MSEGIETHAPEGMLAAVVAAVEPPPELAQPRELVCVAESGCSIRIPPSPAIFPCAVCTDLFPASGPTGYLEGRVICDSCLLSLDVQLGMVLTLVALIRDYGDTEPESPSQVFRMRAELLAFARIYENWAVRYSPRRPPVGPGFWVFGREPPEGS